MAPRVTQTKRKFTEMSIIYSECFLHIKVLSYSNTLSIIYPTEKVAPPRNTHTATNAKYPATVCDVLKSPTASSSRRKTIIIVADTRWATHMTPTPNKKTGFRPSYKNVNKIKFLPENDT